MPNIHTIYGDFDIHTTLPGFRSVGGYHGIVKYKGRYYRFRSIINLLKAGYIYQRSKEAQSYFDQHTWREIILSLPVFEEAVIT